ncbi:hypothetical protein Acor_23040 [Acrocarpospora corrugata]|uniref:RNA polymerase sigma factor n=1 Tax=Acrocarpospora corrugata TaxID=35763 RepID=A0A5M3VZH6_9ACTN|nr:sigma factor [Acrocarpospora corrugata]GES00241.1 hypothetical protein Acor_23040 [Acrocarpospora corrugata]
MEAEDLVQDTYARAWAAWLDGRHPRKAAPWLATICLNLHRDRRRTATRAETSWPEGFGPPGRADVEAEAINHAAIDPCGGPSTRLDATRHSNSVVSGRQPLCQRTSPAARL